jgi:hypothetical protein
MPSAVNYQFKEDCVVQTLTGIYTIPRGIHPTVSQNEHGTLVLYNQLTVTVPPAAWLQLKSEGKIRELN